MESYQKQQNESKSVKEPKTSRYAIIRLRSVFISLELKFEITFTLNREILKQNEDQLHSRMNQRREREREARLREGMEVFENEERMSFEKAFVATLCIGPLSPDPLHKCTVLNRIFFSCIFLFYLVFFIFCYLLPPFFKNKKV